MDKHSKSFIVPLIVLAFLVICIIVVHALCQSQGVMMGVYTAGILEREAWWNVVVFGSIALVVIVGVAICFALERGGK